MALGVGVKREGGSVAGKAKAQVQSGEVAIAVASGSFSLANAGMAIKGLKGIKATRGTIHYRYLGCLPRISAIAYLV